MKTFVVASLLVLAPSALAVPIASGKLVLPPALAAKAKDIRTVFIAIADPKARTTMPCAAQKFTLEKDASGEFLPFTLDTGSLTLMGCPSLPETMTLKAKLDKDGSAGRDAVGDIVGTATEVKKGANVIITLDHAY